MSASNANNAAVRRQVTCETSDNGQIAVYLDILRLSDTFKKMYEDLGLEEHDDFPGVFPVKTVTSRMFEKNAIFIPNEVLLTIFEKLPREDLERLQFVSTQFRDVIVSSSELSEQQGPLRVVAKVEFGAYSSGSLSPQRTRVLLRDGTRFNCTDCKDLAKRLKFAIVQELRWDASTRWLDSDMQSDAYIQNLSSLLPVKSAWKNAAVKASVDCFPSSGAFEFLFTHLLLCKEIVLVREYYSLPWSRRYIRLAGIAACNRLDIGRPNLYGDLIHPNDVVEWLEQEDPPEKKWSEPRQMILYEEGIHGGIEGLLTGLKAAFLASSSPKPYVVRILRGWRRDNVDQVLENEKTHEVLSIHAEQNGDASVHRA